ncbi:hypothetical protein ES703_117662 [subsurface metagenome]
MNKLGRALSRLLNNSELTSCLVRVLGYASKKGRVSYREVEKMVIDGAEDVLLLGNEWRLLLPVRTLKSAAWEDRLLVTKPEELYEMPNIVRYLAEEASRTGHWNPEHAITELFREMGESDWEQMPKLVEWLGEQTKDYRITAAQIKMVCSELGLGNRVDALIAELKGSGIMSPKLGALAEVTRAGVPIYELNPSLFIKKGEKV